MPKRGEEVLSVPISKEAGDTLKKVINNSGLGKTELVRHAITAAFSALAERDYVVLPIKFEISGSSVRKTEQRA